MDIDEVPQDGNVTLGGHRKAVYARGADGKVVVVPTSGWEAEEIVTLQAVDLLKQQADEARARVEAGTASTLEYWMYARRMDLALLAQGTGIWRWRVKRHLRPEHFARLDTALLQRYADALGLSVEQLQRLP